MPVDLTLSYADGTREKIHHSIGIWEKAGSVITVPVKTTKKLNRVVIGSTYVPDKNDYNNFINVK